MSKKILIIGASSGLGLYLTKYFNSINYDLFTIGRNKKKVTELRKLLNKKNKSQCKNYDLNNNKQLKKFLSSLTKKKFDVVIHCIGGGLGMHDPLIRQKDLEKLFNINVGIAVQVNNQIIRKKLYNKNFKIIHIGSVAGVETGASVGYSMVKASLISYTKTLSRSLIMKKIFVHCILAGGFEYKYNSFERLRHRNKKVYDKYIKNKLPMKKLSTPNDFLGLFKLLISDEGNILTGSSITADFSETNSFRI